LLQRAKILSILASQIADFAGSGPLVRIGKPALAAGILALLFGRAVHAMQTKAGIERAVMGFLEEAPIARFRKYSVPVHGTFPCHSSRY
jgi:hypothetical protein